MFLAPPKLYWQPMPVPNAVNVYLDRTFASACAEQSTNMQTSIRCRVWQQIGRTSAVPANLITFCNGILPSAFTPPGDGLWLELEAAPATPTIPLMYTSHNADHPLNQYFLVCLFSSWAQQAAAAINWD